MSEPTRAAAFFDLDKTVIATSSFTAFTAQFLSRGVTTRRALLRTAYAQALYLLGGADHQQTERLRRVISAMVTGWDAAQVNAIAAETLHEVITPVVYAEALTLIEAHHRLGRDVVVVSASGIELVQPISRMLGADHAVATRMKIVEGTYTGEIDFYCYGPNKAVAIQEIAEREGYRLADCYAYSDSITDEPMLSAVGHPFVVNPDRALRRVAAERDWQVLTFTRPTPLRPRLSRSWTLALATIAAGLGTAALGWYLLKHRGTEM